MKKITEKMRVLSEREYAVLMIARKEIDVQNLQLRLQNDGINLLVNSVHHVVGRLKHEDMLVGQIKRITINGRKRPRLHIRITEYGKRCCEHTRIAFSSSRFRRAYPSVKK